MNRYTELEEAKQQIKRLCSFWGEKAGWDDGEPYCPYKSAMEREAWMEGFRKTRKLRQKEKAA
jgi:ribosome modulation factor